MKCKYCKCKVEKEKLIVRWINYFCSSICYSDFMDDIPKKVIKYVSTKNKNTPAKFTKEVKAQILLRDKHCIFCNNAIQDYHHVFYWAIQAEHWQDRNNVNKWVWLCRAHHERIHHFSDWTSQELRNRCIEYLKQFN